MHLYCTALALVNNKFHLKTNQAAGHGYLSDFMQFQFYLIKSK